SLDARDRAVGEGSHWSKEPRANLSLETFQSRLTIQPARETDSGQYKCRIDFHRSPTRNSIINLTVVGEFLFKLLHFFVRKIQVKSNYKSVQKTGVRGWLLPNLQILLAKTGYCEYIEEWRASVALI
ncbi:hypothetical protein AAG570_012849, partial [Ranatra chinensis]